MEKNCISFFCAAHLKFYSWSSRVCESVVVIDGRGLYDLSNWVKKDKFTFKFTFNPDIQLADEN